MNRSLRLALGVDRSLDRGDVGRQRALQFSGEDRALNGRRKQHQRNQAAEYFDSHRGDAEVYVGAGIRKSMRNDRRKTRNYTLTEWPDRLSQSGGASQPLNTVRRAGCAIFIAMSGSTIQAAEAHHRLAERSVEGKLLLDPRI